MADFPIATNQWIKNNITPAYQIPTNGGSKCPTKSEIRSYSGNLISISSSYVDNQCIPQKDLSIGTNKKAITFFCGNPDGVSVGHLDFNLRNGELEFSYDWNPDNNKGQYSKTLNLMFLGFGARFNIYIEKGNTNKSDLWYKDSTCGSSGGSYVPSNYITYENGTYKGYKILNDHNFNKGYTWEPNWEYDIWLSKITWFQLSLLD